MHLTNYAVNVSIENSDPERGYAYGMAKVKNKYEMQDNDKRELVIPIIIKDRMLKPLDVFMEGDKVKPLNEDALNQALFVTSPVELSDRKPQERDISNQYVAPTDRWNSYGNIRGRGPGYVGSEGAYKMASILDKIKISHEYVNYLSDKIANSIELKTALYNNPYFYNSVSKIASSINEEENKELNIEPNVIQFKKIARNLVSVKTANRKAYKPEIEIINIKEASAYVGDSIYNLPLNQYVTISFEEAKQAPSYNYEVVKEAGNYECITREGSLINGNILKVAEFDGSERYLMISRDGYALQEQIVGRRIDNIKEADYNGHHNFGIFISKGFASCPIKIAYIVEDSIVCKDTYNRDLQLYLTPHIKTASVVSRNEYAIPEDSVFVNIPEKEISLKSGVEDVLKLAALKNVDKTIIINKVAKDLFVLEGYPLNKIAGEYNEEDTHFVLGACGLKVNLDALKNGEFIFKTANTITTLEDIKKEVEKKASLLLKNLPELSVDLIKEAAAIPDQDTVDTILSLGMITPDTIIEFVNSIPQLEEASNSLAKLLLHVRIGLSSVPEEAVEGALRNLLLIIKSLKGLKETNLD
jgi:hypothetical protein